VQIFFFWKFWVFFTRRVFLTNKYWHEFFIFLQIMYYNFNYNYHNFNCIFFPFFFSHIELHVWWHVILKFQWNGIYFPTHVICVLHWMNVCELASKNNKQVINTFIIGYISNNLIIHMKITICNLPLLISTQIFLNANSPLSWENES
jgi:hypothetical protein